MYRYLHPWDLTWDSTWDPTWCTDNLVIRQHIHTDCITSAYYTVFPVLCRCHRAVAGEW